MESRASLRPPFVALTTALLIAIAVSAPIYAQNISGTIAKEDGSPLSDARVLLLRRGVVVGKAKTREIKSAADGSFTFDKVKPGAYRVWAISGNTSSRDKIFGGEIVTVPKTGDPAAIKLAMKPGRILKAKITTPDGKPIVGASIHIRLTDLGAEDFPAGSDGTVTIEALTPESWEIEAVAPGKAKAGKRVNLGVEAENTVEFALTDGGSVFGKATGSDGKPAAKVGVNVYAPEGGTPSDYVETGDDGTFRVDHLPLLADQRIYFSGKNKFEDKTKKFTLSTDQRESEVNVALDAKAAGGSIAGKVIGEDGKPVEGAQVVMMMGDSSARKTAKTDAAGAFRLDGIEPSHFRGPKVYVFASGWAPHVVDVEPGTPAAPGNVPIQLNEKGHKIGGRVVDDAGKPVKGAWVTAGTRDGFDLRSQNKTTDDEGRFSFDTLSAGQKFNISAAGFSDLNDMQLSLDREEEIEVVLPVMGGIAGTVTDAETDKPVERFTIRLRNSPRTNDYVSLDSRRSDEGDNFNGPTGGFRLDRLDAGTVLTLAVAADGYPTHYFDDVPVTPAANGPPTQIKLAKKPADYVRVAGKLTGFDAKALAGIEIRLIAYVDSGREHPMRQFNWGMLKSGQLRIQQYIREVETTKVSADGTFAFDAVPPGEGVDLAYWGPGVPQTRIEAVDKLPAAERENLNLKNAIPASVAGRFSRKAYPRVPHLDIEGVSDPSFELEIRLDEKQESFKIPELPAGKYTLNVMGEAIPAEFEGTFYFPTAAQIAFEVQEAEAKQLDIGFEGVQAVSGRVSADGKPLVKSYVALYSPAKGRTGPKIVDTSRTDAEGKYRFGGVRPGKYILIVTGEKPPQAFLRKGEEKSRPQTAVEVKDADVEKDLEIADPAGL